uniref:Major facilitator superfamily (MFS) profile domain-containing protein n=1 Tax=Strigamia maritima TaxID=126957 RepID=T1JJ27_STRMM
MNMKNKSIDMLVPSKSNWSKRQWLFLISTTIATLGSAICISLQAPFFPAEAERKHVRSTVYGFVFGVYSLTVFVTAPLFGKYIDTIKPLFLLNSGTFLTSSCCILFGCLDQIKSGPTFITFAFIVRIVEAIGEAAVVTSSYAIVAKAFPGEICVAFAFLRAAFGIGLTIGPTIGGLLYQAGGFTLPFACMGGLLLAIAIINISLFWSENGKQLFKLLKNNRESSVITEESVRSVESSTIGRALSIPSVTLCLLAASVGAISIGFFETTLEPHLRQFKVEPVVIGLAFLTTAGSEAISFPLLAWFCNGKQNLKLVIAFGHFLICITYLFVGPAPFIPVASEFWMSIVGLVFHGLGVGTVFFATHVEALQALILYGYSDSFQTYGMISGVWAAFFEFGHFVGPSMSGVIYDLLGFRVASQIILIFQLIMVIANVFYYFVFDIKSDGSSIKLIAIAQWIPKCYLTEQ